MTYPVYGEYKGKKVGVITTTRVHNRIMSSRATAVNMPLEGLLKEDAGNSIILEGVKSDPQYLPHIEAPSAKIHKKHIITVYEIPVEGRG
ncbi:hypothetical protein ACFLZZ_04425 [Nanoarchaeota archaeon]